MAVKASGTTVTEVFGAGPYVAATVVRYVVDVSRFVDRDRFAAYNRHRPYRSLRGWPQGLGTAPIEVSAAGHKVFRLSRRGNRKLNHAVHMVAVTQVAHRHSEGRAYYDRKLKESKTNEEALRSVPRRICDVIFARLVADAKRKVAEAQPRRPREGKGGTALSPAWPAHTPSSICRDYHSKSGPIQADINGRSGALFRAIGRTDNRRHCLLPREAC